MADTITSSREVGNNRAQVQALCLQGKVVGVVKISKVWLIPKDASKPVDEKTKAAKADKKHR